MQRPTRRTNVARGQDAAKTAEFQCEWSYGSAVFHFSNLTRDSITVFELAPFPVLWKRIEGSSHFSSPSGRGRVRAGIGCVLASRRPFDSSALILTFSRREKGPSASADAFAEANAPHPNLSRSAGRGSNARKPLYPARSHSTGRGSRRFTSEPVLTDNIHSSCCAH